MNKIVFKEIQPFPKWVRYFVIVVTVLSFLPLFFVELSQLDWLYLSILVVAPLLIVIYCLWMERLIITLTNDRLHLQLRVLKFFNKEFNLGEIDTITISKSKHLFSRGIHKIPFSNRTEYSFDTERGAILTLKNSKKKYYFSLYNPSEFLTQINRKLNNG